MDVFFGQRKTAARLVRTGATIGAELPLGLEPTDLAQFESLTRDRDGRSGMSQVTSPTMGTAWC